MSDDEETKARNKRSLMIALGLGAFVLIVFLVSVMKMKAGMAA